MTRLNFNPDETRRDDAPYWAAALVLAIRAGDKARVAAARKNLRRLGVNLDVGKSGERKAVRCVRR